MTGQPLTQAGAVYCDRVRVTTSELILLYSIGVRSWVINGTEEIQILGIRWRTNRVRCNLATKRRVLAWGECLKSLLSGVLSRRASTERALSTFALCVRSIHNLCLVARLSPWSTTGWHGRIIPLAVIHFLSPFGDKNDLAPLSSLSKHFLSPNGDKKTERIPTLLFYGGCSTLVSFSSSPPILSTKRCSPWWSLLLCPQRHRRNEYTYVMAVISKPILLATCIR